MHVIFWPTLVPCARKAPLARIRSETLWGGLERRALGPGTSPLPQSDPFPPPEFCATRVESVDPGAEAPEQVPVRIQSFSFARSLDRRVSGTLSQGEVQRPGGAVAVKNGACCGLFTFRVSSAPSAWDRPPPWLQNLIRGPDPPVMLQELGSTSGEWIRVGSERGLATLL